MSHDEVHGKDGEILLPKPTIWPMVLALGIALVWAIYGGIYFITSSRSTGRSTLVGSRV